MHQRRHRLAYTGIACGLLLAVGLIAMNLPVFLDAYDQSGFQIKCGTGYASDLSQAAAAGQHTIPLVVIGSIVLIVTVAVAATVWGRESAFGKDPVS